jgi:hypothetical protein
MVYALEEGLASLGAARVSTLKNVVVGFLRLVA